LELTFWQTLPWRGLIARITAAIVPGVGLYYYYARNGNYDILGYAVAGVLYFAAYFVICWVTRLLTWADIRSLLGKPR
jgi:hypothetical protein